MGRLAALEPSSPARRYNRARAGELIHLDTKKLARFARIGHRITGDRRGQNSKVGWEFVHVAVDDASRLAYVEVLPDRNARRSPGVAHVARLFRKTCRMLGLRHIRNRPYTPKTNGNAERFIQTLMREWAYALPYRSSDSRAADLPRWLHLYNYDRPHASLAARSTSRLAPGQTLNNPLGNHS